MSQFTQPTLMKNLISYKSTHPHEVNIILSNDLCGGLDAKGGKATLGSRWIEALNELFLDPTNNSSDKKILSSEDRADKSERLKKVSEILEDACDKVVLFFELSHPSKSGDEEKSNVFVAKIHTGDIRSNKDMVAPILERLLKSKIDFTFDSYKSEIVIDPRQPYFVDNLMKALFEKRLPESNKVKGTASKEVVEHGIRKKIEQDLWGDLAKTIER